MADPVSIIASVGLSLTRILMWTGEDAVDGLINLLGTPPSYVPIIENSEALFKHGQYGLDRDWNNRVDVYKNKQLFDDFVDHKLCNC